MRTTDEDTDAVRAASALLGRPCFGIARIGGGRNSRVYRADADTGPYALKLYFRHGQDSRDRRATEFAALTFLRRHGVRAVPEPLASDADLGASLFGFVQGVVAKSEEATATDVERLADFLVALRRLSKHPDAAELPTASEAMFSLDALVENISRRLHRLTEVEGTSATQPRLTEFLRDDFRPTFGQTVAWTADLLRQQGLERGQELEPAARTLSPSDFGFHNVLRTPDGRLVFVDFEYFGWDDPAKMVSDFLLHPGMAVARPLRGRFLHRVLSGFGSGHALGVRVRAAYALYALKWCMILLNEFVPEHLERRLFANPGLKPDDVQRQQLGKARAMLTLARDARAAFPYEEWMCSQNPSPLGREGQG
jgi:Phosphotransferase enzyme family